MPKIKNVELLREGTWNDTKFTESDLDALVESANQLGFRPPLKAGHVKDQPGMPALGFVENFRRQGKSIVADFVDMPRKVFEAVKSKAYNTLSVELFRGLRRNGKTYDRAFKAVALLGADVPAVDLSPLSEGDFIAAEDADDVIFVDFQQGKPDKGDNDMDPKDKQINDLKAQIDELTQTIASKDEELSKAKGDTTKLEQEQKNLSTALDQTKKRLDELHMENRRHAIQRKVSALKIPSLREPIAALYEAVDGKEDKFTQGDKEQTAEEVLDTMVDTLNRNAASLFAEYAAEEHDRPEGAVNSDPSAEVDRLTTEYMEKNKVEYSEALNKVLELNPKLAEAYHQAA